MKTITIQWTTDDVLFQAKQMEIELTEKDAENILDILESGYSTFNGINWETIDDAICQYVVLNK